METREELLTGLNYVKETVTKIINIQQRQVKIVAQYREEEASVSVSGVKNMAKLTMVVLLALITAFYLLIAMVGGGIGSFLFCIVLEAVLVLTWNKKSKVKNIAAVLLILNTVLTVWNLIKVMDIGLAIILLMLLAVIIAVIVFMMRWKNNQIARKNTVISEQNKELHNQYDIAAQQMKELKQDLYQKTSSWYPGDYYSLDAVDFFIHAVSNHRADSVKEMVNLFETSEHQRRMEVGQRNINASLQQSLLNQEQIKKELRFANVMNMANLVLQADTKAEIQRNTNAVYQMKNSVNSAERTMERTGDSVRHAIDKLRK